MSEEMTRREFVVATGVFGASLAVAGAAGCVSRTRRPEPTRTAQGTPDAAESAGPSSAPVPAAGEQIETPSWTFGEENGMAENVLVGYATRTGSTVGVAEAIGKTLAERGYSVDVKPLRQHPSLDGYDACVIGSAINGGQWLPEAISWVEAHRTGLKQIPFAAFCVHSMNGGDDAGQTRKRLAYLDKVREVARPVNEGFFLGKGPTAEDTSLIARWAFKAFGGSAEGDARDWAKIRRWAGQVRV